MTEHEIYYLKSCLESLRSFRALVNTVDKGFSLGDMVLADNIDWLNCFIDKHERANVVRRNEDHDGKPAADHGGALAAAGP
jgi:hypothetical protein